MPNPLVRSMGLFLSRLEGNARNGFMSKVSIKGYYFLNITRQSKKGARISVVLH